ncbi:hypothetical protein, partial [Mesorhizobium sp. M0488]|uniref:hypothetical protein n=1 Tax=Mesorhizobium sp. M0488 TaxID=2956949 RepID=UPI00333C6F5D
EVGEDAVATLRMELVDRFFEEPLVVHVGFPISRGIIIIALLVVHRAVLVKMPRPGPVPNDGGSWPIPPRDKLCGSLLFRHDATPGRHWLPVLMAIWQAFQ